MKYKKRLKNIETLMFQISREECVVSLPTDNGFTDRTCPDIQCQTTFKVNMNSWLGGETMYCVKCGKQYAKGTFTSAQQHAYAKEVAINLINDKYELGIASHPETYIPPDADTEIVCTGCQCCFVVRGKFGYCPQCGRHSCLQWAIDELLVLKQQNYTQTKTIQTGYKETVDVLKTCGDQILAIYNQRHGMKHSISLQNFSEAVGALHNRLGINLNEALTSTELQAITIAINVRHIYAYNAGVIDSNFIKRTQSHSNQLGRIYQLRSDELQLFIGLVERLLQFYFHAISSKF